MKNTCYDGTYIVRPESTNKGSVGVLKFKKMTANIDSSIGMSKYLNYPSNIIKYFWKDKIHIRWSNKKTFYSYDN
ncbi:MAG: hypothetical protein L6V81_08085 [Clostridium sp.]|nr:MAG: hypothetical protein L6V81_08085 [Clostridium sp.]